MTTRKNNDADSDDSDTRSCQVVIIGAGVSGLQCARSLIVDGSLKEEDVILLEARDRIGGRVHTRKHKLQNKQPELQQSGETGVQEEGTYLWIDDGAAWVHGVDPVCWDGDDDDSFHVANDRNQLENPVLEYLDRERDLISVAQGNPWTRPFSILHQTGNIAVFAQASDKDTRPLSQQRQPFLYCKTGKHGSGEVSPNNNALITASVRRHYQVLRRVEDEVHDMYNNGEGRKAETEVSLLDSMDRWNKALPITDGDDNAKGIVLALTTFYQHMITTWQGLSLHQIPVAQYADGDTSGSSSSDSSKSGDADGDDDSLLDDDEFEQDGDFFGPHCTVRGGMHKVVQALCTPEILRQVRLQQEVVSIEKLASSSEEVGDNSKNVRVKTKDGSVVHANVCVVTIPVGCLQENHATLFMGAPLSAKKQEAFQCVTMGRYKKVFLTFDSIFWPAEPAFLGMILQPRDQEENNETRPIGDYLFIDNLWAKDGNACFEAILAGDQAVWATNKPDDVIRDVVLDFVHSAMNLPAEHSLQASCLDCHVTRWEEDPYSRGAYAGLAMGGLTRHIEELRVPEWDGALRFAGDASSFEFEGSVPAALMSGKYTARTVQNFLGYAQAEAGAAQKFPETNDPTTPIYDEVSWRKLPEKVREAAMVLGYNQKLWDRDKDPATTNKSWKRLTSDQQRAAGVLGYTKEQWDSS